jgi:hypothetical protein
MDPHIARAMIYWRWRQAESEKRMEEAFDRIQKRIDQYRRSLIRWMFIFFILQELFLIGFFIAMIKLTIKS